MIVVDELGWEINHFELHLPPKEGPYMAPGTTPETWSHVHMILNHFPTVGFVFALVFYLIALAMNNDVHEARRPRRLRHLRRIGRPDLCHRRRFDVGVDRPSDPGDFQGADQRAPRHGVVDAVRPCVYRRRGLDRAVAVSAPRTLFQPIAVSGPGLRDRHSAHNGRNRSPRRTDQSPGDPIADGHPADRSESRLDSRHRIADQQRDLVRAVADRALLRLLADLRHGSVGGGCACWDSRNPYRSPPCTGYSPWAFSAC